MKHTPGPWNLIETTHEKIVSSWDVEIGEHLVSVFPYKRIYSDDIAQSGLVIDQEKMSNARLIAAAPDLFEALIEIEQMVQAREMNEGTMEVVRNAIVKAGE